MIDYTLFKTMKEDLLIKAKQLGCFIYQDSLGKWVIRSSENKEIWSIEEEKSDTWIVIYEGKPQILMETKEALEFLETLNI